MFQRFRTNKNLQQMNDIKLLDDSTMKIITLASAIIVFSVLLMGSISFIIARDALVKKLKTKDMIYIARSITSRLDEIIGRATETSMVLSRDPAIVQWVKNSEKDVKLGRYAIQKINDIAKNYNYNNSFIVSNITKHYWSEDGKLIDTMSVSDPDDTWFFHTIAAKKKLSIEIDYNKERKDTFVFIDALVGDPQQELAITGVGLNLKDLAKEFKSYKFGKKSNMWLVDSKYNIYMSEDVEQIGKNILTFIPSDVVKRIANDKTNLKKSSHIIDYINKDGETYDLISQPLRSTEWKLILQIPRSESVSIISSIKTHTILACIVNILLIIFIFRLISRKISNPYKRAILLNQELEKKVFERTLELNEKNEKIMDSIEYAKLIQESTLPSQAEFAKVFDDYFIIWRPRDTVGGDFYFLRRLEKGSLLVLGDCTGHGVPGALMTMAANSILNHIIEGICDNNPASILKEMNRLIKHNLNAKSNAKPISDGLDAGIVYIADDGYLLFAGSKISMIIKDAKEVRILKGNTKGIGDRNTSDNYEFINHKVNFSEDQTFYLSTDGFFDQNGGEKNLPFGKKRFKEAVIKYAERRLQDQKHQLETLLENFMANEPQRDDITVVAFTIKNKGADLLGKPKS